MTKNHDRIEPDDLPTTEVELVMRMLQSQVDRPRLVGGGESIDLPQPLYELLIEVLTAMRQRRTVVLIPEDEEVTTQQAANILGVSRPHVVKLLEQDSIPYSKTGTHRKIKLVDLRAFQEQRDAERRRVLDELFGGIESEGGYE